MASGRDTDLLIAGVLAGERLAIARAITQLENGTQGRPSDSQRILRGIFGQTGRAHIVGITGAPGTGKSTLVASLAGLYRAAGMRVGVVAIDPTSPFTGGALLGDRVRMQALSGDPNVFVRSMATRGSLGGLSSATNLAVMVLDAAGFERVLIETVGVGQAEIAIAGAAYTTVVVEAPGMGDEIQAIKAGILEIADILVVNKADRPGANRTVQALEMMLELGSAENRSPKSAVLHHGQLMSVEDPGPTSPRDADENWRIPVLKTIAANGKGVDDLYTQVEQHQQWLHTSGQRQKRERRRITHILEGILHDAITRRVVEALPKDEMAAAIDELCARRVDPFTVAARLLDSAV